MIETSLGIRTSASSNITDPPVESLPKFQRTSGSRCFCPESLTAANQFPACLRSRNARIKGLSPFVQLT